MCSKIKMVLGAALLLLSGLASAANEYKPQPVVIIPSSAGISANATGYWRSAFVIGFEFALVSGRYYINQYQLPTCGMVLRIDAAVPRINPSDSLYGRAQKFDPNGAPIPYGTTMNLLKVYRPGLVGTIRVDSYDAASDTLTVTVTSPVTGAPNGTFVMYRDQVAPFIVSMPPC